jgi:hypothetical protein
LAERSRLPPLQGKSTRIGVQALQGVQGKRLTYRTTGSLAKNFRDDPYTSSWVFEVGERRSGRKKMADVADQMAPLAESDLDRIVGGRTALTPNCIVSLTGGAANVPNRRSKTMRTLL